MSARRRRLGTRRGAAAPPNADVSRRRLLIDTHVWLWWQTGDSRLGPTARRVMASAAEVRLSAASVWEMAIKISIGKLTLPDDAIDDELAEDGFLPLPVEIVHAEGVRRLPRLHGDPFDRLLVAQAQSEGLTILTADSALGAYGVPVLDATS